MKILRVDGSMRRSGSISRQLTDELIETLGPADVTVRDLADPIPHVSETWMNANFTDEAERSADQKAALAFSGELVEELKAADTVVIGVPIYNFGVPAGLKAWIDMICRARLTFKYTENGPVGLLEGKEAYVVLASGGVPMGSPPDFTTEYMKFVLGFVGITDVTVIDGSAHMKDLDAALNRARDQIAA
ncbi:MAG: NAD(P)H-dependent oxidoreductase [Pseudomonadota bacterium]